MHIHRKSIEKQNENVTKRNETKLKSKAQTKSKLELKLKLKRTMMIGGSWLMSFERKSTFGKAALSLRCE